MKLLAVGVDHRSAPAAIREALAFEGPRRDGALSDLGATFPGCEFVVLSTCNRVELYAAAPEPAALPELAALANWLVAFHGLNEPERLRPYLVPHRDEAVVGHLFRVAASLESLVLGEGQILGQVRDAYRAADQLGRVGPILHETFQQAIRVGKLVREQTGMDRGKLSVASVAVDLAREVFDTFADKTVLVIGVGKMGELTLQHLSELKPGRILITNRTLEKARAAAERWRGAAVPFDQLSTVLTEADLIIGTTSSPDPLITRHEFTTVQRARKNRLALILDIALPRDFEPAIGDLEQVLLYNVDDLKAQVERNLNGRKQGLNLARVIIEREAAACFAAITHRHHAGAILRELGDFADSVRARELEKLFHARPDLSDDQRAAISQFAARLQNQYLHQPRTALRSTVTDTRHSLLSAVRHLFGLNSGE